jgi:hypothetical protein
LKVLQSGKTSLAELAHGCIIVIVEKITATAALELEGYQCVLQRLVQVFGE